jgi:Zn-dependent protease
MAWLNLLNLIPLAMLDGGQVVESIIYSLEEMAGAIYLTLSYALVAFVLWIRQGWEYMLPKCPNRMLVLGIVVTLTSYLGITLILLNLISMFASYGMSLGLVLLDPVKSILDLPPLRSPHQFVERHFE